MHYVYSKDIKRQIENAQRFCIYLNKLERYKFKMAKGLQQYLPNEHLDRKENDFLTSSSEDQSFLMT